MTAAVLGMRILTNAEPENPPATVDSELLYSYCSGSEFRRETRSQQVWDRASEVVDGCRSKAKSIRDRCTSQSIFVPAKTFTDERGRAPWKRYYLGVC